jgi:hypothetical protein
MNLLGKIFVVANLVFTVLLMVIAVFVYATHRNWKDEATRVSKLLGQSRAENTESETRYRRLDSRMKLNVEEQSQQVRKLEAKLVEFNTEREDDMKDLVAARAEATASSEAVDSTQIANNDLTTKVKELRVTLLDSREARDDAFKTMVAATDTLHQVQGQYSSALERQKQLVADLADKNILLNEHFIDPNTDPGSVVPRVRGVVSATRRTANSLLIELTVGSDDGLKPGHKVEVFRGERYLGRAEILKTEPDRAVGRIMRQFQQGQIQEGDHVATKLRVG